jgi:hypothetical protein
MKNNVIIINLLKLKNNPKKLKEHLITKMVINAAYSNNQPVSRLVWLSIGVIPSNPTHSLDLTGWLELTNIRCLLNLSHKINTKNIKATNDTIEPTEDTEFHKEKASG